MSLQILQRRMAAFVDWIATDSSKENEIRDQAKSIRKKICAKADDGLTVQSTPNSGSFAKALRMFDYVKPYGFIEKLVVNATTRHPGPPDTEGT